MNKLTKILQKYKSAPISVTTSKTTSKGTMYSIDIACQEIVDLVPEQMLHDGMCGYYDDYCNGWNECCKKILKRMAEK